MDVLLPVITAYVVIAGSSAMMYALARWMPGFTGLSDWTKRLVHVGLALVLAVIAVQLGGVLTGDALSQLMVPVLGAFSVLTGGLVFRMGRSQPGNPD